MTAYFSFTPDGGRIGRIHWRNTGAPAPLIWQRPGWGQCAWDSLWPLPQPDRFVMADELRRIERELAKGFQPLTEAIAQAAEGFAAFGRAARAIPLPDTQFAPIGEPGPVLRIDPGEQLSFVSPDAPEPTELW